MDLGNREMDADGNPHGMATSSMDSLGFIFGTICNRNLAKKKKCKIFFCKKKRNFMSTKMLGSVIIDHNWSNLVHQDFADFLGIIVGAELPIKLCRILEMESHLQNPTKFFR